MRAPVLTFPRTRPSSQGSEYLNASAQGPEAFGLGVAKGVGSLGSGLVDLAADYQYRNAKVDQSRFLMDWTEFETEANIQHLNAKRGASADLTNFPETSRTSLRKSADDFVTSKGITDPRFRSQFEMKYKDLEQKVILDSIDFQFKQQDAYFATSVNDTLQRLRNKVNLDPTQLESARLEMIEALNGTALSPDKKVEMANLAEVALEASAFGAEVKEVQRGAVRTGPPPAYNEGAQTIVGKMTSRGLPPMQAAVAAGNMQQESGFRTWAHNEKEGAHGLIQWRLDRWDKMQAQAGTAGKDWRDPDFQVDFFLREFKHDYPEAWAKFINAKTPEEANAAIKQYIRYGDDSEGTRLANAKAILAGADPKGDVTARDDTVSEDMISLNNDPRYSRVPLEQRTAMTNAAQSDARQEANDIAKAAGDAIDAKLNMLAIGLHDGTMDETHILKARNEGWLSDIDDLDKMEKILEGQQSAVNETAVVQATLDNNGQGYNRVTMNGEKNKGVNAWVGKEGLDKISMRDDKYMDGELLPAVGKWDDIPTTVIGQLESMAASNNTVDAAWALQRLQNMKDIAPNGFISRTTENRLGERVEAFRNLRGLFGDDAESIKEMLSYVNGGTTPEAQRVMKARDEDARTNLNKMSSKQFLIKFAPSEWGLPRFLGGYGGSQISEDFEVSGAYELAGRELYVKNFRIVGNDDDATTMTQRALNERWGLSVIGDSTAKVPMEWPPEKVYAHTKVPMEVYADQIRRAFNLTDDEGYRLVSDDTTYREIGLAGRGQLIGPDGQPRLPSYRVKRITKNGNSVEDGRWFGDPVTLVEETE